MGSSARPRPTRPALRRWLDDLQHFLLPAGCVVCGRWIPRGGSRDLTCATCRSRLPRASHPRCARCDLPRGTGRVPPDSSRCRECSPWPAALAAARSAFVMAPPADALVHAIKYGGWARLASEMGRDMASALDSSSGPPPTLVTFVPTTPRRARNRGYNQAFLLAEVVARRLGLPCRETLCRTRDGPTQVALPPSLRRANVEGAFSASILDDPALGGAHVILVDDVLTTGATAAQAARVLDALGVRRVTVLTYARALPVRGRSVG